MLPWQLLSLAVLYIVDNIVCIQVYRSATGWWVWVMAEGSSHWLTGTMPSSWRHNAEQD